MPQQKPLQNIWWTSSYCWWLTGYKAENFTSGEKFRPEWFSSWVNFEILRMALTNTMTLLILVNFWLSSGYWLSRYLPPRQTIMDTSMWGLVCHNFPHSIRICTRDECVNIHTRTILFLSLPLFPFLYFLSSFLPSSFLFLSSLFSSQTLHPSPTRAPVLLSGTWDVMVCQKITDPSKSNDVELGDSYFLCLLKKCVVLAAGVKWLAAIQTFAGHKNFEGLRVNLRQFWPLSDGCCVQGNAVID